MELISFMLDGSPPRVGVHVDGRVVDLGDGPGGGMLGLLAGGDAELADAAALAADPATPTVALSDVQLLAPVPRPGKIFASAANFADHVLEGGGEVGEKQGREPLVFSKLSSSVIGPGAPIVLPSVSQTVDWELELAVVIGRRAKHVRVADALDVVAGYGVFNDVSARTMSYPERTQFGDTEEWFDFINGKWCDSFAAFGPFLVTADAVADPHALDMRLRVNDRVWQDGSTSHMIFRVPEIIAFITRWATLEPGDVIVTGTPGGTGEPTDTYLRAGDVVEGTISGLGTLTNPVVVDDAA
jgi:2-keto-4-pentenoate hydratase/2-oxohepta-3-ene-1,7-dioic acid hydratase in catechol pathway